MGRQKNPNRNPTDYKRGFNAENYERLYPWAKKGRKAFYNMAAKQARLSLNEFIITAIEEKMKRETPEIHNEMQQQEKTIRNSKKKVMIECLYHDFLFLY